MPKASKDEEIQKIFEIGLRKIFPDLPIEPERNMLPGRGHTYSPRLDIAVGSSAINNTNLGQKYSILADQHMPFLDQLHQHFSTNIKSFGSSRPIPDLGGICSLNQNAHCFLAIEIQGSGSRKHTMGGMINAAALGRVGISVACSASELRKLLTIREYLLFLESTSKSTFGITNLLIVTKEQFAATFCISLKGV